MGNNGAMRFRAAVLAFATLPAVVGLAGCGGTTDIVVGGAASDSLAAEPAAPAVLDVEATMRATAALSSMTFAFDLTGGWFPMQGRGAVDVSARTGSMDVEGAGMSTTVVVDGQTAYLLLPPAFAGGVEDRWLSHSIEGEDAATRATVPGLDQIDGVDGAFVRVGPDVRDGVALTQWRLERADVSAVPAIPAIPAVPDDDAVPAVGKAAWMLEELRTWAKADDVRLWTAADGSVRALRATSEQRTFDVRVTSVGEPVVVTVPDPSLVRPFGGSR